MSQPTSHTSDGLPDISLEASAIPETGVDESSDASRETGETERQPTSADIRRSIIKALMMTRAEAARDKRLLSAEGIVEVAKTLGVQFPESTFNTGNVASFVRACQALCTERQYNLLSQAIVYVALGQAALDANSLPTYIGHEYEEPTQSYIAAIELVDKWLDGHSRDKGVARDDVNIFRTKCYKDAWKRSVDAAKAVTAGIVEQVKDKESGEKIKLGEQTTTHILLHDSQGKPIGGFPTFNTGIATLGESPIIAARKIQGTKALDYNFLIKSLGSSIDREPVVKTTGDSSSLPNKLFPGSEFPDRDLLKNITVESVMGVVPIALDRPEALFQVYFDGGKEQYQIDIITGENFHGSLVNPRGGISVIGVPSSLGNKEAFFSARSLEILSEGRTAHAEDIGEKASTSVMLVIKPVTNGAKATFRRKVLHYRMGTLSADKLAKEILDNTEHDEVLWLQNAGWITGEQAGEINGALATERKCREEGKIRTLSANIFSISRSTDWGGSFGSEDSFMMRDGGGGVGLGSRLHTGSSGIATGVEYGRLKEKLDPDPFANPKILIVEPFGIRSHEDPKAASAHIASVIDIHRKPKNS